MFEALYSLSPTPPLSLSQNKFSLVYSLLQQMVVPKLAAIFTRHGRTTLHSMVQANKHHTPLSHALSMCGYDTYKVHATCSVQ